MLIPEVKNGIFFNSEKCDVTKIFIFSGYRYQFKCKYCLIVKNISITSYSFESNSSNLNNQFSISMQLVLFNP